MTINEQLEILQAAKDGKSIQLSSRCENPRRWFEFYPKGHIFNFSNYEYRVKPELRAIWVNEYSHGAMTAHASSELATLLARGYSPVSMAVKYVEVLE